MVPACPTAQHVVTLMQEPDSRLLGAALDVCAAQSTPPLVDFKIAPLPPNAYAVDASPHCRLWICSAEYGRLLAKPSPVAKTSLSGCARLVRSAPANATAVAGVRSVPDVGLSDSVMLLLPVAVHDL